ncbi:MAG: hypothetical protein E7678_00875 [Ruminococcaceae bacterium]|nr:hypothetical protein [Oscillospiraceae bacterium]
MWKRILNAILIAAILFTVAVLVVGLTLSIYVIRNTEREIDSEIFEAISTSSSSTIYYYKNEEDRINGNATQLLGEDIYGGFRNTPVEYEEIPQDLINAFICIEDKRFFQHNGVDWKRTIGAAVNYFLKFRNEFGGSTITQQLIKNVTGEDSYSLKRKIQEIFWAIDLESKMSKEEILCSYLNIINLSNGCYGVGAAAKYYFSKDVSELTLGESVAIAAITNNPSYYDLKNNPENNKKRRRIILDEMLSQGYITEGEYDNAYNSSVILNLQNDNSGINTWYVDMVLEDVINELVAKKGYTREFASKMIYTGGLKIYTAMDIEIQELLEAYYSNVKNFNQSGSGEEPQSAMIIINPYNGAILGVAGAIGQKSGNRLQNYAIGALRPAGSVIKPISVYAPALEKNIITWSTVYDDTPVKFSNTQNPSQANAWPKNVTREYRGLTTINYAIEQSVNTVSVKVLSDVGLDTSFDFLKNKLHIDSLLESKTLENGITISDKDYAALGLGQFNYGVSLLEMTAAYSIFVNKGIYSKPRSFYKVTDANGNVILENEYQGEAVISEENAIIMTKMLQNVLSNGTAKSITLQNKVECAGKTGTTQDNCDRWYIGYTPYYVGGVWYGYEYPKPLDASTNKICIETWDKIMTKLHQKYIDNKKLQGFDTSENIVRAEYCKDSGQLVCEACEKDARGSRTEVGYFVKGTEPKQKCKTHILVRYDKSEECIASNECNNEDIILVGMIKVKRIFPTQIYITDAQYVWRDIDKETLPETASSLPFFNNLLSANEYSGISKVEKQFNSYCRKHFNYQKWKDRK